MSDLKIFSSDISVSGKRIIVRLDLNVPINNSKIDDDTKIKVIEPFINKLIENKAKVILLSHLGRPKGKAISELSLKPIFNYLEKKLNGKIYFYQKKIDSKAVDASNKLKPGEVLLFENIRFFKEEEGDEVQGRHGRVQAGARRKEDGGAPEIRHVGADFAPGQERKAREVETDRRDRREVGH